jgi:hypothetical protein
MFVIFGDSFARIFSLFKDTKFKIYGFKGATLKGLTKLNNENRNSIEKIIKKNKNIKYVIFSFGQVDLNLSFYYDIVKNNGNIPKSSSEYYMEYINKYIEWISNLSGNFKRIIIAPYPSPLNSEFTINSLINYGSLTKEDVDKYRNQLELVASDFTRNVRYFEYLYCLENACKNNEIIYINLNKYILNDKLIIKDEFYDISKYNMHLRWSPLLPYIITEFKNNNIPIDENDIIDNMNEIEELYLKEKKERLIKNKDYYI